MGGYLGFGTTPGGDGIITPLGTIYAGGTNGRERAAQQYWAGQQQAAEQAKQQNMYDYLAKQSISGVNIGAGGPAGMGAERTANARYNDPKWLTQNVQRGVLQGDIDYETANSHSNLFTPTPFLSPAQLSHDASQQTNASRERIATAGNENAWNMNEADNASAEKRARAQQESARWIAQYNGYLNLATNEGIRYRTLLDGLFEERNAVLDNPVMDSDLRKDLLAGIDGKIQRVSSDWENSSLSHPANPRNAAVGVGQNPVPLPSAVADGQNPVPLPTNNGNAAVGVGQNPVPLPSAVADGQNPVPLPTNNGNAAVGVGQNPVPLPSAVADGQNPVPLPTGAAGALAPVPGENQSAAQPKSTFPTQKLGSETYDMNEDQMLSHVIENAKNGVFFDLDDINPQLKQRIMYELKKLREAGSQK